MCYGMFFWGIWLHEARINVPMFRCPPIVPSLMVLNWLESCCRGDFCTVLTERSVKFWNRTESTLKDTERTCSLISLISSFRWVASGCFNSALSWGKPPMEHLNVQMCCSCSFHCHVQWLRWCCSIWNKAVTSWTSPEVEEPCRDFKLNVHDPP